MSLAAAVPSDHPGGRASTVDRLLEAVARRRPDAVALVAPGRPPLTYGRLAQHILDLLEALAGIEIGQGDRVAVALPPGAELAVTVLALSAGATCAPLNPAHRPRECEAYFARLDVKALVVEAGVDSPARAAAVGHGIRLVELSRAPRGEAGVLILTSHRDGEPVPRSAPRPDDIALLLPTSGTTSASKLVPLSHANLCASARGISASLGLEPTDRCLNLMPLFHVHGFMALLASLAAGGSVVCPPAFDASRAFAWMDETRPTWCTAVPAIHRAILAQADLHREVIARRPLRFIRSASAALPRGTRVGLERAFAAPVIEAYGMTEASHQIASNPLPPGERRAGSVGLATGVEVAVVDDRASRSRPGRPARSW